MHTLRHDIHIKTLLPDQPQKVESVDSDVGTGRLKP